MTGISHAQGMGTDNMEMTALAVYFNYFPAPTLQKRLTVQLGNMMLS